MAGLRLVDLVALKAAGEIVMKWLPKSKLSEPSTRKLKEAIQRAKKLIAENKG